MALIEIKNLSFSYPGCSETIKNINLSVEQGDFVALFGPTGSGKTTLLRLLKPELSPLGETEGSILFGGKEIKELSQAESSAIGFVQQSTEHQTVTDKVWHEIAFGMENLNYSQGLMSRRMAEVSAYFGIDGIFESKTSEISGGQKQLVALAEIAALDPEVIILDEPTSQLDPISANEFLNALKKLNSENGVTIIISEHRLENVIPLCSKICAIDGGEIKAYGSVRETAEKLLKDSKMLPYLPGSARLYSLLGGEGPCPLSVTEGRAYLKKNPLPLFTEEKAYDDKSEKEPAVEFKKVYFRYDKDSDDVLRGTDITAYKNEILCILGANGSGKTTMLCCAAGLLTPYSGKIRLFGKDIKKYKNSELYGGVISYLPQNPEILFMKNTLREEMEESGMDFKDIPFDLSYAADIHPYDLSGGERQMAAIAKVMASKPEILLLDEPTKGLDPKAKRNICEVLKKLKEDGITIIAVTHDVEFAALCADRAAMFFRGAVTCTDKPREFFSENIYYTTSISKITRDYAEGIITDNDLAKYIKPEDRSR